MLSEQGITEDEYTDWLVGDWGYNSKEYKEWETNNNDRQ
jgi:hypothetical protein